MPEKANSWRNAGLGGGYPHSQARLALPPGGQANVPPSSSCGELHLPEAGSISSHLPRDDPPFSEIT